MNGNDGEARATKTCYDCKRELTLDKYGKNKAQPDGHAIYCIECTRKRQRTYIPKQEGAETLERTTSERPLAGVPLETIKAELKARGFSYRLVKEIVEEG